MIEKYLSSLLVPYFSQFVENIDHNQFRLDLWGGKASLNDLILKPSILETLLQGELGTAFSESTAPPSSSSLSSRVTPAAPSPQSLSLASCMAATSSTAATPVTEANVNTCVSSSTTSSGNLLPLILQRGLCKKVNIVVPLTQLRSKPVVIEIDELFICLRRNTTGNDEVLSKAAKLDAQAAYKARELEQFEAERKRVRDIAAAASKDGGNNTTNTSGVTQGDARSFSNLDASSDNVMFPVFPAFSSGSSSSYFSRIGELIINNIVVKIRSVHVRYEDETTRTVIGAILAGVQLLTIDSATGKAKFVDSSGQKRLPKRLVFDGLQLYCDDPVRYDRAPKDYFLSNLNDISKWIEAMRRRVNDGSVELSTILGPIKGSLDVSLIFKEFLKELINEPYLVVRMNLSGVVARLNRAQYLLLIRAISLLSNWRKVDRLLPRRPNVPINKNAAVWWRYAIRAVRSITGAPRRERLLQRISEVCIMDYHVLYRDVVRKTEMSAEKRRNYRFITRFMTVSDMIAGRKYVYTQIANAIQLKRKDGEAKKAEAQLLGLEKDNKRKKGFFSWFRRESTTDEQLREEKLALEELKRLYGIDPNNPEEKDTEVQSLSTLPRSYCWVDLHFDLPLLCLRIDLTKSEVMTLMLRSVGATFKKFNAPNSVQISFVTDDLTLSNPLGDKALLKRMPALVESVHSFTKNDDKSYEGDEKVVKQDDTDKPRDSHTSFLHCHATFNPVTAHEPLSPGETNPDLVLHLRVLPLRIVADPPTIDNVIRFFEVPKGLDLDAIMSSTRQIAATLGQAASTELSRAMAHLKSFSISVDVAAPFIIFPKSLLGSLDEPALAVSLGRTRFETDPLSDKRRKNILSNTVTIDTNNDKKENYDTGDNDEESLLYYSSTATFSNFYVELAPISMILENPGKGFMLVPEIAFSSKVLQRIDHMNDKSERFIFCVDVPALRMACSVSQAYVLSGMVEGWLLYLEANAAKYDNEEITPSFEGTMRKDDITAQLGVGGGVDVQQQSRGSTVLMQNKKVVVDSEPEDTHLVISSSLGKTRDNLPFVRFHVTVKELGIVIFEDDTETQKPLDTARFTLAFSSAEVTLHVGTLQKRLEILFGKFFCCDAKDPSNLILSGSVVCCNLNTAPDSPMKVDVRLKPSLRFCCGTPCIQLLETLMDIANLITLPTTETAKSSPMLRSIAGGGGGGDLAGLKKSYFYSMFDNEPQAKSSENTGTTQQDRPLVYLSLHIAGAVTIELMDRRKKFCLTRNIHDEASKLQQREQHYSLGQIRGEGDGENNYGNEDYDDDDGEEEDYPFASASFTETNLLLKKNLLTFEVSGGIQQVTFSLSEAHDIAPENRTIVQYKAPFTSTPLRNARAHSRGDDEDHLFAFDFSARQESHEHINFAYRTSLPVVPLFYTDNNGRRKLENASDLRFSAFVEIELKSSSVLLDVYSIMTITQYFSSGFFANVAKLTSRPRYDGRAILMRSPTLLPSLLTSVRVYARDLLFLLPIDARKNNGSYFHVNVDHVVAQNSLLAAEGQQTMNISLCEIHLFCGCPSDLEAETKGEENQQWKEVENNALMPRTTLDISLKTSLDPLSDELLRVDLRCDHVTLAIAESDIVELCNLASGNLARFPPPPPPPPAPLVLVRQEEPKSSLSAVSLVSGAPEASLLFSKETTGASTVTQLTTTAAAASGIVVDYAVLTGKQKSSYEVRVTWRANNLRVKFLDHTRSNVRFRLEGNFFIFNMFMPGNDMNLRWESLEFNDVHEKTQLATMLLCGSSSVELRNILTNHSILQKSFGLREKIISGLEATTTAIVPELADFELSATENSRSASRSGLLEIPTLLVDFTLKRFAISDQWLAVYDFVCNEAVMEALRPIMTSKTATPTRGTEKKTRRLSVDKTKLHSSLSSSSLLSQLSETLPLQKEAENTIEVKKGFRFQLTTRAVNVPFLTVFREEFIEADIKSLFIDSFSLSNTTNMMVRVKELTVRHSASGEYILYKQGDISDEHMPREETTAFPLDAATIPPMHISSNFDFGTSTPEGTASNDDVLTFTGIFDAEAKQQKVAIAVGQLSALCSMPLVMQIIDYCTGVDQPIAKISNLGVMREQREWLARTAESMVKNGLFCLNLLWRRPRIVFAGDAQEISNKSRNIEAQLGVMQSRVFLDKSKSSCVATMKVADLAISEMLEKTTFRVSYTLKEKSASLAIVMDKILALFHPAEVEKLLWILQRNFMAPVIRNETLVKSTCDVMPPLTPLEGSVVPKTKKENKDDKLGKEGEEEEENEKKQEKIEQAKYTTNEDEELYKVNEVTPLTVEFHAKGIELALYDVVRINSHTLFIGGCDVEIKPNGDVQALVSSFKMVEHFTNRELLHSVGENSLTMHILSAEKTTHVRLVNIKLLLVPKALGTLFNMLLYIQFPPPLRQDEQSRDLAVVKCTAGAKDLDCIRANDDNERSTENSNVFIAGDSSVVSIAAEGDSDVLALFSTSATFKSRLCVSLDFCGIDAMQGNHGVFSANVENSVLDWKTYADESSTFTASVGWITVRDDLSLDTRYSEVFRPLVVQNKNKVMSPKEEGEKREDEKAQRLPGAIEFLFASSPQKKNNDLMKGKAGCDLGDGGVIKTTPSYVYQLRGQISSFQVVLVPELTSAIVHLLSEVKDYISEVNCEKACDYVADKTAHAVQRRKDLTLVELALKSPAIIFVEVATSTNTVELFPGDIVVRNKLCLAKEGDCGSVPSSDNFDAEKFYLYIDRMSLTILGASAFSHQGIIEISLLRSISNLVDFTNANTSTTDSTTLSVTIPTLSINMTQKQLNCIFDVIGAFRFMDSAITVTEGVAPFASSASQGPSCGYQEGAASAASVTTPITGSFPNTIAAKKKTPVLELVSQQHYGNGNNNSNVNNNSNNNNSSAFPQFSAEGPVSSTLQCSSGGSFFFTANMQRVEAQIDNVFQFCVDQFCATHFFNSVDNTTTTAGTLDTVSLQHQFANIDITERYLFLMKKADVMFKVSVTRDANVVMSESDAKVKFDSLQIELTPLMFIDTNEVFYEPFCKRVLRVPFALTPVCKLTTEIHVLESDLVLDSYHIIVVSNETRCLFKLDLNQHTLFLSGFPSAQIILDDNCHLTITNGIVVISGMYSLSSFVSFGLNAVIVTTDSCVIEKMPYVDSTLQNGSKHTCKRSKGSVIDFGGAFQSKRSASLSVFPTKTRSQSQSLVRTSQSQLHLQHGVLSPCSSTNTPKNSASAVLPSVLVGHSLYSEETRVIFSFKCPQLNLSIFSDVINEIGVAIKTSLDFFYTHDLENGVLTQRSSGFRLTDVHTNDEGETKLLPTTMELTFSGVNIIRISVNLSSLELCLRAVFLRSFVDLWRDFMRVFTDEIYAKRPKPQVTLEDNEFRSLVTVQEAGECYLCGSKNALIGESTNNKVGILCRWCCTGRTELPLIDFNFDIPLVDVIILTSNGGMLQIYTSTGITTVFTSDNNFELRIKLQIRNLNNHAAIWEPLVEKFDGIFFAEMSSSKYILNVNRFDYVFSPENTKFILQLMEDVSYKSTFRRQLRKKFFDKKRQVLRVGSVSIRGLNKKKLKLLLPSSPITSTTTTSSPSPPPPLPLPLKTTTTTTTAAAATTISKRIADSDSDDLLDSSIACGARSTAKDDRIYAIVVVKNYCYVAVEIDGKKIGPCGDCLEFTTTSRCGILRSCGGGDNNNNNGKNDTSSSSSSSSNNNSNNNNDNDNDNDVVINWIRSPLYVRKADILVEVSLAMAFNEHSDFLQRVVRLYCYPVHESSMIIYVKNNISAPMEILPGFPAVEPKGKFYFNSNFLLDEKLYIKPVLPDDQEEYEPALTAQTLLAPTLRMLLNGSITNVICIGTKNPQNVFAIRMKEEEDCVRAGIPAFFISIEPRLRIQNCLPNRVFVSIITSGLKRGSLYDVVIETGEITDVLLCDVQIRELSVCLEVYQHLAQSEDSTTYKVRGGAVPFFGVEKFVKLYGGYKNNAAMCVSLRSAGNTIIISTPYTISNFTPLELHVSFSERSDELGTSSATNFSVLPKNMQVACAASPKGPDMSKFFVDISTGSILKAHGVPLHVQGRGVITLKECSSVSLREANNTPAFHLVYLSQFDRNGICSVVIVPRWVLVNRTPRPLYVVQALEQMSASRSFGSNSIGFVSEKGTVATNTPVISPLVKKKKYVCDYNFRQLVPPHSSTPFIALRVCNDTTGYGAFLLQERNAPVFGEPVSLEEIGNTLLVAYGQNGTQDTNSADIFVETSVVIDEPYTFVTLQEPAVPPYIILNRTGICLEFRETSGRFITKVMPGCIEQLVSDVRSRNGPTRIYFAEDTLKGSNSDLLITNTSTITTSTIPTNTAALASTVSFTTKNNTNDTTSGDDVVYREKKFTDEGEITDSSVEYAEFNFNQSMTEEDARNPLGIEYILSLGPFGQQIIEIIPISASISRLAHIHKSSPSSLLDVVLKFDIISVSVVRENNEVLFGALADMNIHFNRRGVKECVDFSIKNFQVDNHTEIRPFFEVALCALRPSEKAMCISGYVERTFVPARSLLYVDEVRLDVVPFALRISDNVLIAISKLVRELTPQTQFSFTAQTDEQLFENAPLSIGIMNIHIIVDRMVVNPLVLRLWFEREADGHDFIRENIQAETAALLSMLVRSCEDVRISIPGIVSQKRFSTVALLLQWVMNAYFDGIRNELYGILFQYASSLPLIGAPIKLASGVGSGALKFFREPIVGLSTSPKAFALGLANGSSAFVTDVVSGGLSAVSNLAKTGAGLVSVAAGERKMKRMGFLRGIASGVAGVVTKPMEGAAESGAAGLVRGVGMGLLGVVAHPMEGLFSDVYKVAGTAAQLCDDSYIPEGSRMRKPRDFHAVGAVAEYQSLVSVFEYERGEPGVPQWVCDNLLPGDGPNWYPNTKEQIQNLHNVSPNNWKLDLYNTNFEGWKFSSKYYGIFTRVQEKTARIRRRRWVLTLKAPPESRLVLHMRKMSSTTVKMHGDNTGCRGGGENTNDNTIGDPSITGSGNYGVCKGGKSPKEGGASATIVTQQQQETDAVLLPTLMTSEANAEAGEENPQQREQQQEESISLSRASQHFFASGFSKTVNVVELYEYEFKVPLIGWSSRFLPTGFSQWQYSDGRVAPCKSSYELPPGYVWSSEWTLSSVEGKKGDVKDLWEYVQKEKSDLSETVRRRCWRRAYKKKENETI